MWHYGETTETGCTRGFTSCVGRGIERTRIFRTDQDREDFLNRLA